MTAAQKKTTFAESFIAAQKEIGSTVAKDAKNPHFKSDFASLAAVCTAIHEPLNNNGLGVMQEITAADGGINVITTLVHAEGDKVFAPCFVPVSKNDAQGYGSAATYARRYSLMALFGLAPSDDDGNAAAAAAPVAVTYIDGPQALTLSNLMDDVGADEAAFLKYLKIKSLPELEARNYPNAIKALEAKRKAAQAEDPAADQE